MQRSTGLAVRFILPIKHELLPIFTLKYICHIAENTNHLHDKYQYVNVAYTSVYPKYSELVPRSIQQLW
jgi:hypothetical protein